jgi:hypothetical protein
MNQTIQFSTNTWIGLLLASLMPVSAVVLSNVVLRGALMGAEQRIHVRADQIETQIAKNLEVVSDQMTEHSERIDANRENITRLVTALEKIVEKEQQ